MFVLPRSRILVPQPYCKTTNFPASDVPGLGVGCLAKILRTPASATYHSHIFRQKVAHSSGPADKNLLHQLAISTTPEKPQGTMLVASECVQFGPLSAVGALIPNLPS